MIIYQSTKAGFLDDTFGQDIEAVILGAYQERTGRRVAMAEIRAWKESLIAMAKVLRHESIPDDCGIAIEYVIPQTAKRIDMLMSGHDDLYRSKLIIIELKQWETAARTDKDGLVRTRFAGGEADTSHPSYRLGPTRSCCGISTKRCTPGTFRYSLAPTFTTSSMALY